MEQRRSWFSRFRPRLKSFLVNQKQKNGSESTSSREAAASSKGVHPPALADDLASSITRQKVAAAKQYIENHYKSQMKNLQERKERYAKRSLSLSPVSLFSSGLLVPTGEAVQ
jgi:serine/threonine kinase 38